MRNPEQLLEHKYAPDTPVFDEQIPGPVYATRLVAEQDGRIALVVAPNAHPTDSFYITARSLRDYRWNGALPYNIWGYLKEKRPQIITPGGGLAELQVLAAITTPEKPPIVIDPMPLSAVETLLRVAYPKAFAAQGSIEELLSRIELMKSGKIRLINTTLEEAVRTHPELRHTADVVVDVCGPSLWKNTNWRELELTWLLKTPEPHNLWTAGTFKE